MTTLPDMRVIVDGYNDVELSEEEVHEIEDAICLGRQRVLVTGEKNPNGDGYIAEACLTRFTDPRTNTVRWAVESWGRYSRDMRKTDHATHDLAKAELAIQCDRLGI